MRAGLRAADAVLFVVSASDEIDDATRLLWRECETTNMPRAIAVTKLEQSRADFEETMARCRRVFGDVQPLGAPLIEDGHVVGAINLLRRTVTDYRSGEPMSREPDETEAVPREVARRRRPAGIAQRLPRSPRETARAWSPRLPAACSSTRTRANIRVASSISSVPKLVVEHLEQRALAGAGRSDKHHVADQFRRLRTVLTARIGSIDHASPFPLRLTASHAQSRPIRFP